MKENKPLDLEKLALEIAKLSAIEDENESWWGMDTDLGDLPRKIENVLKQHLKSVLEALLAYLEAERVDVFPGFEDGEYDILYDDDGEFIRFEKINELIKKWFPNILEEGG